MASVITSNSIKLSFTGPQVDWTRNTSAPRTGSYTDTEHSPSAKWVHTASPSEMFRLSHIPCASAGLAFPVKTLISFPCEIINYPLPDSA